MDDGDCENLPTVPIDTPQVNNSQGVRPLVIGVFNYIHPSSNASKAHTPPGKQATK